MQIIDAHTHIGKQNCYEFQETPDEMIFSQKKSGVNGAIFHPMTGTVAASEEDMENAAAEALALYEKNPDFLYPGITIRPEFPEKSLYLLDMFCERGFVWVGECLSNYGEKIQFDDERWVKLFRICAERNLIVQLHNAPDVVRLAKLLPELTVVGSHLYPAILPELVDLPNVVVDISGMHGGLYRHAIEHARSMFGYERLLYGTDMPGYDQDAFIVRTKRDFPEEEQEAVFAGNLLKLLREHNSCPAFGQK